MHSTFNHRDRDLLSWTEHLCQNRGIKKKKSFASIILKDLTSKLECQNFISKNSEFITFKYVHYIHELLPFTSYSNIANTYRYKKLKTESYTLDSLCISFYNDIHVFSVTFHTLLLLSSHGAIFSG